MDVQRKLEILADAAKYDASCASSGTEQRDSSDGKGLGSTAPGMGICHSYAPDGRCISLLKVLLTKACKYADRLSINIEMPLENSLAKLAPEKDVRAIRRTMGRLRLKLDEAQEAGQAVTRAKPPPFAPAGQSTQMIVGADSASDKTILDTSANLYGSYALKRVYYSAFSPIPDASAALPLRAPPLIREHRLYQADW